jgi:hypothetical protein
LNILPGAAIGDDALGFFSLRSKHCVAENAGAVPDGGTPRRLSVKAARRRRPRSSAEERSIGWLDEEPRASLR